MAKNDDLHAERRFLESVIGNWWQYRWLRSRKLCAVYDLGRRGPEPMTRNGGGPLVRGAVPSRELGWG